jgi:hypothetical protein
MSRKKIGKTLSSAAAVVAAAPVAAGVTLNNPPNVYECSFDEDGFHVKWQDQSGGYYPEERSTKYGGDLEVQVTFGYYCEGYGAIADEMTAVFEYDLDTDAEAVFSYDCVAEFCDEGDEPKEPLVGGAVCEATLDWEVIEADGQAAAESAWNLEELAEECDERTEGDGELVVWTSVASEESVFSNKEIDPGNNKYKSPGQGRGEPQNRMKSMEFCDDDVQSYYDYCVEE